MHVIGLNHIFRSPQLHPVYIGVQKNIFGKFPHFCTQIRKNYIYIISILCVSKKIEKNAMKH